MKVLGNLRRMSLGGMRVDAGVGLAEVGLHD